MRRRAPLPALLLALLVTGGTGCAALSGFSDFEKVDDAGENVQDSTLDTSPPDGAPDAIDATDGGSADSLNDGGVDVADGTSPVDTGIDSAPIDSAPDGTGDAPADAIGDATSDATDATDAGDSGVDSTLDSTVDSGADTGVDSGADSGTDAPSDTSVVCPVGKGPTMVATPGGFCIDSTEVTNAHYTAFVAAGVAASTQPSYCSWNTSWTPPSGWGWPPASTDMSLPVTAVDWCDAYAYCKWAGKRLCGHPGSGATPYALYGDPKESEWHYACTANGTKSYPYGSTYDATACQGGDIKPNKLINVGSKSTCVGGYPGIFDMSGNAYEWEDACDGATGSSDNCHMRGGGIYSIDINLLCSNSTVDLRKAMFTNVGFRCCAY